MNWALFKRREERKVGWLFDYATQLASDCRKCVQPACTQDAAVRSAR